MRISDIMRHKGSAVATIAPEASVTTLLAVLRDNNIGAVVVTAGDDVVGIVSERDVVRRLCERGAALLAAPVAEIMTSTVFSCALDDSVDSLADTMTQRRIRHVPVVVEGRLRGIVSIGDVVKSRITELELDREQLASYIERG